MVPQRAMPVQAGVNGQVDPPADDTSAAMNDYGRATPQASTCFCKWICKRDAAEPAELEETIRMARDL